MAGLVERSVAVLARREPNRAPPPSCLRALRVIGVGVALALWSVPAGAAAQSPAPADFTAIAALLQERCVVCHRGESAPLGLRLDTYAGLMAGSSRGAVVVPGDPEASELIRRLEGSSLPRMPLTGPPFLDDAQIGLVRAWIAGGAPGGETQAGDETQAGGEAEAGAGAAVGPGGAGPGEEDAENAAAAGASQPVTEPAPQDADVTFASVEPIFLGRCASCHTAQGLLGAPPEGLRLDSYDSIMAGSERLVVVPGNPLASELYRRVVGHSLPRMPFDGPPFLGQTEIDRIGRWIAAGAQDAAGLAAVLPAGRTVRLGGTLTGLWELDGLPLRVTATTRFDDAPGVGDYVEVRGTVTAAGDVLVERLRTR